ncbi:MAG: alcohol dehydrogenase catalytic domain-containing protein [Christensenellales bacterium]|jgi:threonine dehydrogenase-like Zn-dependent dehydrogenase
METMLSAVFKGNGVLALEQRPVPKIQTPDEVLLKVISAGICGSDLHILHVPPGQHADVDVIMGHEIYGEVIEAGPKAEGIEVGNFVTVDPNMKCGTCDYCKHGMPNMCELSVKEIYGQTLNGGFAPYVVVRSKQLYKFPFRVSGAIGGQTEPLACVMNGIKKANPSPLDNIILFGAGPIGLLYLRCFIAYGVKNIIVCEMAPERQEYAKQCGATAIVDPSKVDLMEYMLSLWGEKATVIVDAVGASPILEQSIPLLQSGGKHIIFGQNSNAISTIHTADIVVNELQIIGSYITKFTFPSAIKIITTDGFGAEKIVSHRLELKDIVQGVELAKAKKASRVIIYPNGFDE